MIQSKSILKRLYSANSIDLYLTKCRSRHNLSKSVLTPRRVTELLCRNQINLANVSRALLPNYIKSIECNQLASNSPIEDRLRVSVVQIPGRNDPTLMCGVFDGHGGGKTADLVSRRLFHYIALSLHPELRNLKISTHDELKKFVIDLHFSPKPEESPESERNEINFLSNFKSELGSNNEMDITDQQKIVANIKSSFQKCDDDIAKEIQDYLLSPRNPGDGFDTLHYYLSAAVSGCCAAVMIFHDGIGYLASTGDCRAVEGLINLGDRQIASGFTATDLNVEHNCDNVNEIRRLAIAHPKSEQNTMIKHNRLLGHLMPFRAFGDFNYKWPADLIKACGITRAFGSNIIPSNYETPPYLITEPDVRSIQIKKDNSTDSGNESKRCFVIASDGLWEFFESSRDVIETVADHTRNYMSRDRSDSDKSSDSGYESDYDLSGSSDEERTETGEVGRDYDQNCATHILRTALKSSSNQDVGLNPTALERLYHLRLETILTLPSSVSRNFRDDISIILLKM